MARFVDVDQAGFVFAILEVATCRGGHPANNSGAVGITIAGKVGNGEVFPGRAGSAGVSAVSVKEYQVAVIAELVGEVVLEASALLADLVFEVRAAYFLNFEAQNGVALVLRIVVALFAAGGVINILAAPTATGTRTAGRTATSTNTRACRAAVSACPGAV